MKTPRLLIVDDNEVNRILIERIFLDQHYETVTAESGQQALEILNNDNSFDLVLLDVMMPGMDGLSVLERIRAAPHTRTLPVVLISAMSDSHDIVRGLEMGANDYITKPLDMNIALARVNTQLSLKLLMDERQRTIERLKEVQQVREQFFRIASHDLKQPLTSLRVGNMLLQEFIDPENERAFTVLETMRLTIQSMSDVVNAFLDSAAAQRGEIALNLQPTPLDQLLQEVHTQHIPTARDKNVQLDVSPTDAAVICDAARLSQVIGNVMSNAVKYTYPGTTVTVRVDDISDDIVRVSIVDQGPGIPDGERDRLFQPFSKLSNQPTNGESSHGLGLWIARQLVQLQNGDIGFQPTPAGGAVFWVAIPRASQPPAET